MYNRSEIENKLKELMNREDIIKRFYHLRSIENFIYFLDVIEDTQLKEKVYLILIEYFDVVKNEPIQDIHHCTKLFDEYIRPIGSVYEENVGFMPMIHAWVIIFWGVLLFVILYMFSLPLVFYYLIGGGLLFYYGYVFKKRLQQKVYGFKW